jgi:hypothetical protein
MEEALRLTNGNKSAAARMLGLKRTTLVAKLRRKSAEDEAPRRREDSENPFGPTLAASTRGKDS